MVRAESPERVLAIDGMRGYSIIWIILIHAFQKIFTIELETPWHNTFYLGSFGVPLFFCTSGYLVYASLERSFIKSPKTYIKDFFIKRSFRILPLWFLVVLVYLLWGRISGTEAIAYSSFYFGFNFSEYDEIYVSWSLFVEEVFYLCLMLVFTRLKKIETNIKLFIVTFFISLFTYKALGPAAGTNPLYYIYYFLLGIIFYKMEGMRLLSAEREKNLRPNIYDCMILIPFVLKYLLVDFAPVFAVTLAFIIFVYRGNLLGFLSLNKFIRLNGRMLFSLYLIHPMVIDFYEEKRDFLLPYIKFDEIVLTWTNALLWLALVYVTTFIISLITYNLIEKPFIRYSYKLVKRS